MDVTLLGMVTKLREEQWTNAAIPMLVTPVPMITEVREVQ